MKSLSKWSIRAGLVSLILLAQGIFTGCSQSPAEMPASPKSFSFSVMGDIPRSVAEIAILDTQITQFNALSTSQFMFHLGDIKAGSTPCDEAVYQQVSTQLKNLDRPLFMLVGDNEWNDCDEPEQAWSNWLKYYAQFEDNWSHSLLVSHQAEQPDNFAFSYEDVLFIGLNIVGGRIYDQDVWDEVESHDIAWLSKHFAGNQARAVVLLAQADPEGQHPRLYNKLKELAETYSGSILFIHGDGHKWMSETGWAAPNITKIQVDKGGIADPIEVIFRQSESFPFIINRKPFHQ